jgi:hypothetical protein
MSKKANHARGVEMTLLRRILVVVRFAPFLAVLPVYLMWSPLQVNRTRSFSTMWGFSLATILRYVAFRPTSKHAYGIKNIVLVPVGMSGRVPCANLPISFAAP